MMSSYTISVISMRNRICAICVKLHIGFIVCCLPLVAIAQVPLQGDLGGRVDNPTTLTFTDTIHDFGDIAVSSGYNTCQFEFVNASDSVIYIIGALSSCGCTIPEYPHEAIAPGQRGVVRVTYDTLGRPAGPFDRSIVLQLSGDRRPIRLRLRGNAVATTLHDPPSTFV